MKNKPLELDNDLNKTNVESGEKSYCSINDDAKGVLVSTWKSDKGGNGIDGQSGKVRVGWS